MATLETEQAEFMVQYAANNMRVQWNEAGLTIQAKHEISARVHLSEVERQQVEVSTCCQLIKRGFCRMGTRL